MPILSSDTLFHFTTWDNLIGILENDFYPKFSLEKFSFKNKISIQSAVPMISFCDIPLSKIKLHVNSYGSYGIGLKKEWGITKGINPVLYIEKNSNLSADIYNLLINILRKNKEESAEQSKQYKEMESKISELENNPSIYINKEETKKTICEYKKITESLKTNYTAMQLRAEAIFNVIKHVKPYEEYSLGNHESNDKLIRFYDEREWRYVPDLKTFESYLEKLDISFGLMDSSIFSSREILTQANSIIESAKLSFKPDDIKYIIVREESEILNMIRKLDEIKGDKYPSNIIKILTSRILTYDQIKNDF